MGTLGDDLRSSDSPDDKERYYTINRWFRQQLLKETEGWDPEVRKEMSEWKNYFQYVRVMGRASGFQGQELEQMSYEILESFFYNPLNGGPGLFIYYKPESWDKFINFFAFCARKKINNYYNNRKMRERRFPKSVIPSGFPEREEELSENRFPQEVNVSEEMERGEDIEKRKHAWRQIRQTLSQQRGGDVLVFVWDIMNSRDKPTLQEMANRMNQLGLPTAKGGNWSTGAVDKVRSRVIGIAREFLNQRNLDIHSLGASRSSDRILFCRRGTV